MLYYIVISIVQKFHSLGPSQQPWVVVIVYVALFIIAILPGVRLNLSTLLICMSLMAKTIEHFSYVYLYIFFKNSSLILIIFWLGDLWHLGTYEFLSCLLRLLISWQICSWQRVFSHFVAASLLCSLFPLMSKCF